jgi:hypothetical protein
MHGLCACRCGLIPVMLGVQLGCFGCVVSGVMCMPVRSVSVVRRSLVIAGFVMLGGLAMMMGGVFVVLSGVFVVFSSLLGHVSSLKFGPIPGWWPPVDCARLDYGIVRAV